MKRSFFIILFPLLFLTALKAQEYASGLIMDDESYEQEPREPRFEGSKYTELPAKVDWTPYCPEVAHQGEIQSCVGWALGYGALTIQRAIQNDLTDPRMITQNANSALFIYNQIKQNKDCDSGAKISDAVQLLTQNGDCLSNNFDADINNCDKLPNASLQQEASRFAIADYMTLFSKEEDPNLKVLKVQKALANQQPVVIGLKIYKNFHTLQGMTYWRPEIGRQIPAGGHAVVVVGYDEFRSAFQIMNSWGKEWGKNGFVWIKFKDFGKYCKYAYVLHLGEPASDPTAIKVRADIPSDLQQLNENHSAHKQPIPQSPSAPAVVLTTPSNQTNRLAGSFIFKYLDLEDEREEPILKPADVTFNGQYYKVNRTNWDIGQFFQLVAIAASSNDYIYVFSVDMTGKVHIHWPRQEGLNEKFKGLNESPLVTTVGSEIYIPGKNKGLKLSKKGIEHLCILFSTKKIENIKAVSDYMSDKKDNFYTSLTNLLKNFIVPPSAIQFADHRIQFTTNSGQGFIVPIVLELEAE